MCAYVYIDGCLSRVNLTMSMRGNERPTYKEKKHINSIGK